MHILYVNGGCVLRNNCFIVIVYITFKIFTVYIFNFITREDNILENADV